MLDFCIFIFLAIFLLLGFLRGLKKEFNSLINLFLFITISYFYANFIGRYIFSLIDYDSSNFSQYSYPIVGCIIVFFGVVVAIAYGNSRDKNHRWELIEGNLYLGVIFGIGAALCQAIGLIMMKPILIMGADPIASASLRTVISCIFLAFTFFLNYEIFNTKTSLSLKIISLSIISGFLGMALGMSLLLIALQHADAGIVATLSSTSPIMILFLIWLITKKIPTAGAWIGTTLAIIGSGLIFIY